MVHELDSRASLLNKLAGEIVFTIAGGLWIALGVYSLAHHGANWLWVLLAAAAAILLATALSIRSRISAWRFVPPTPEQQQFETWAGKRFVTVNIVQGIAAFLAAQVWNNLRAPEYFGPTLGVIVGLHFIALAPAYRSHFHRILGAAMCLLSLGTISVLPKSAGGVFVWGCVIGFGNGLLLWASAATRMTEAASVSE